MVGWHWLQPVSLFGFTTLKAGASGQEGTLAEASGTLRRERDH